MARPSLQMSVWYFAISRREETLESMSLHVAAKIHEFFRAYRARGFGTALCRAAKIVSSLVGSIGGQRGGFLRPPSYRVFSFREALYRQPRTK